ncbi:MAG: methylenetetrahydrofolate reductase C-terminal domain-containing protein [Paracoccaceae bacterium]
MDLQTAQTCWSRSDPMFTRIGYNRLERPFAFVERHLKGFFFDCKMCGQCVLSSTNVCPMNCPKQLRNGPCGGVRPGGFCEVKPERRMSGRSPGTARRGCATATGSRRCYRRSTDNSKARRPGCAQAAKRRRI